MTMSFLFIFLDNSANISPSINSNGGIKMVSNQYAIRIKSADWSGAQNCLTAPFPLLDEFGRPVLPLILAVGIDNSSTIAFPSVEFLLKDGKSIDDIVTSALLFLKAKKPIWEPLIPSIPVANFPSKALSYQEEYAAEQVINSDFIKAACKAFNTDQIIISPATRNFIATVPLDLPPEELHTFVISQLFRYAESTMNRVCPFFIIANNKGNLIGVFKYPDNLLDDILEFANQDNDTKILSEEIVKPKGSELRITIEGNDTFKVYDSMEEAIVFYSNKLRMKNNDGKSKPFSNRITVLLKMDRNDLDVRKMVRSLKGKVSDINADFRASNKISGDLIYLKVAYISDNNDNIPPSWWSETNNNLN